MEGSQIGLNDQPPTDDDDDDLPIDPVLLSQGISLAKVIAGDGGETLPPPHH